MTNEETIDELEVIYERLSHPEDCEQGVYSFRDGDYLEALDMAIKVLEQQSCEDCINREATIDAIYKKYIGGKDAIKNAPINDLYADGLAEAVDAVWEMPSVTPKAEQKWIPVSEKLPEDLEPVNITWVNHEPEPYYHDIKNKNFVATGIYYRGQWYWYSTTCADYLGEYGSNEIDEVDSAIEIVAWMPLPKPYKTESEG